MSFFLDTQEMTQRFGSQVTELGSLLDINHIKHGSPNDLFEFARTLDTSNQFRVDLSTWVKSVVKRANDELLLTDMMSIIAAAVGGQSVAETRADITGPTKTLMEFLLGTGCWRQFGSPSQPASPRGAPSIKQRFSTEEPTSVRISLPISTGGSSTEERTSLLDISSELRQTLSRLESNTEQVKHHLDSIEQRISKIEPAPGPPPAPSTVGLEPLVHHDIGTSNPSNVGRINVTDVPVSEPELPNRPRAVFSPSASVMGSQSESEEDGFSAPTFAYGSERGKGAIALWIFLALAVIGIVVFLLLHYGQGVASPAAIPDSTSSASGPSPSSAAVQSGRAVPENGAGTSSPHSTASEGATPNVPSEVPAGSNRPKVRYVPANVMAGYLISAPRPQYPAQARLNHIEGQVVLQATISRSGSIETLHAIKGPASLRGAAIDAVRHWRYRPYSADGQAVKVATTVYVDFTLRPPPAMAH